MPRSHLVGPEGRVIALEPFFSSFVVCSAVADSFAHVFGRELSLFEAALAANTALNSLENVEEPLHVFDFFALVRSAL